MSILDWYGRVQSTVTNEHPVVGGLKKQAKKLHNTYPFMGTLMQTQDKVAQQHGFEHWHHLVQVSKKYEWSWANTKELPNPIGAPAVHRFPSVEELRVLNARPLGYHELTKMHWGQSVEKQRTHTLVTGEYLGPKLFSYWTQECIERKESFFSWVNINAWPASALDFLRTSPTCIVLRLGQSQCPEQLASLCSSIRLHWLTVEELLSWMFECLPNLNEHAVALLRWAWSQMEGQSLLKTGSLLASHLSPPALSSSPMWEDNTHRTLLLAGEMVPWLHQSSLFEATGQSVQTMTFQELLTHPMGILVIDDGSEGNTAYRTSLLARLSSHLRRMFNASAAQSMHDLFKKQPKAPMRYWNMANIDVGCFGIVAAQARAQNVALTYFYNTEPNNESVTANTGTRLSQHHGSGNYVLFQAGTALAEPLRLPNTL